MTCKIIIGKDISTICNWSDDCAELMDLALQPFPDQRRERKYQTTQLRAFNLAAYFRTNGVNVDIEIEDPSEHARFTIWTQKLRASNDAVTDESIGRFIADIGIDFRPLQVRGLYKVLRSHFSLLAVRCGGGKTLLNLATAQYKKRQAGRTLTVVVAPVACAEEYEKELDRFRGYFDLTLINTCGMSTRAAEAAIHENDVDIILVSVDSISALRNAIVAKLQAFDGETILVVEEGHSAKNMGSKRSQGLQYISPLFDLVIVSTATPLPLGPKDLRGYIGLVGLPQPEDAYSSGIPTRDYQLLRGIAFVTDEDDLPYAPLESANIEFDDLEQLKSQIGEAVREEVSQGRKVVIFTATNRALQDAYNLFEGIPRTVLSGSFYVEDCTAEGMLTGRSRDAQKSAINQFNSNTECMILIANYRVGSTGLNLQYSGARMAIFYEITNSGADLFQSKYRIRRPHVFPEQGFRYLFAVPTDPRLRRTVNRQFLKLADQERVLQQIKVGMSVSNGTR